LVGSSSRRRFRRPCHELRERELRLLPARERAGVLERHPPGEAEHPEQPAQVLVRGVDGLGAHVREHRLAVADPLVLLRVVAERDAVAQAERPRVRGGDVREDLEQARLAGPVQPHDQQPLASGDVEPDVLEHRWAAVPLRERLRLEHDRTRPRRFGEPVPNEAFVGRCLHDALLELADTTVERLRLLGPLDGLPAHRVRERLQPLHLGLLSPGERAQPRLVGAARGPVLRVGPPILDDPRRGPGAGSA
jgi:hypothetical protein